jgi:CarboxypepD_reg-like domain/TonB-dependent Receptor Plug Domain
MMNRKATSSKSRRTPGRRNRAWGFAGAMLLAIAAIPSGQPLRAQEPPGRLLGRVVDHANGKPLAGARVGVKDTELNAISDNAGGFVLENVPAGLQSVEVELIGYESRTVPVRVLSRETMEAELRLSTKPIALPPIEVTVRSGRLESVGFYSRREEFGRQGRFMDRAYIESRNPQVLTDLLYNQSGIKVDYGGAGVRRVFITRNQGCTPMFYIDGISGDNNNFDVIRPETMEGMEIYIGAMIPIQYKSRTDCGVILVWTRRGSGRR